MPGPPPGASFMSYLVPMAVVLLVVVVRNSRPRRLKIERLWLYPAIYAVLLVSALSAAPPPVTPLSIGLLVAGFLLGGAIGWQRGRFTQVHIHPETHDLTSRASPIGLVFIFAVLVMRYAARDLLAGQADSLHLPIVAVGDAFIVLAVTMLSVQRLELWIRASRLLAEAKAGAAPPTTPTIVS